MDQMSLYVLLLQSFPETLILIYIGLALTGAKLSNKKITFIALAGACLSYFVRGLPIPPGSNVFVQLPVIVILLFAIGKLPLWLALVSIILGFLCVSFAEMLFIPLTSAISGISIEAALADPLWRILFPIPEFLFLTLLVIFLRRKKIHIFNTFNTDRPELRMYGKPLAILSLSVGLVVLGFYFGFYIQPEILQSNSLSTVLLAVTLIAVILSLALSWKMLSMARQEKLVELQQFHISNLQEMTQIIKGQRHDFVNHLQVIYGLVSQGYVDQTRQYINTLYKDVQVTSNVLQLAVPELSALLLVKAGVAATRNISLEINQQSDLAALNVPSMELVTVVGNLLNNAMEAVENFTPALKTVTLNIYEKSGLYIIQTQNPGYMPPEVKNHIFELGFSTKAGDRGIGLASIKYQVEKHNGRILVSSHPEKGTRFTVCYPRRKGA
ncbi:MAG TPA: Spo0B domain-containing protein [Syntrophomonas sp.]|nr:Spo0B domain-containing protein [Syntrophomonas sp.]